MQNEVKNLIQRVGEMEDAHQYEIFDVLKERVRQLDKFGPQNRPPFDWFLILSEEIGEVAKECVEMRFDDEAHPSADPEKYYKELTEAVAVGLAAMQNFNQRKLEAQHYDWLYMVMPSTGARAQLRGEIARRDLPRFNETTAEWNFVYFDRFTCRFNGVYSRPGGGKLPVLNWEEFVARLDMIERSFKACEGAAFVPVAPPRYPTGAPQLTASDLCALCEKKDCREAAHCQYEIEAGRVPVAMAPNGNAING